MTYNDIYKWVNRKLNKKYRSIYYEPEILEYPKEILLYDSYWRGLETIILDIITKFNIPTSSCLEFGTENGYSAVAFSNYFDKVIGVDIFTGDIHAGKHENNYDEVVNKLKQWKNIELIKSDYRDYIKLHTNDFHGLIHVDIVHSYDETYECGLWAVNHSKCAIFHDTESYPEVKKACYHIARDTGKRFYNYNKFFGLGIIS
ncbi:class I SAM-dependent methyltransferase [Flavihumibacter sp. R14]|nr:class I SAM-dependent methyltransferase [Flavihumibacter soli]